MRAESRQTIGGEEVKPDEGRGRAEGADYCAERKLAGVVTEREPPRSSESGVLPNNRGRGGASRTRGVGVPKVRAIVRSGN